MLYEVITFFVEESRPLFFIYSKFILMLGTFVPIEFFPVWLQKALKYLPFSLVTWGPAKIFVAFNISQAANTIVLQSAWAIGLAAICYAVFMKGARNVHVHGG